MPSIPHRDPRALARKKRQKARSFLPSGKPNFAASIPFFNAPGKQCEWYNRKWWKVTRKRVLEDDPVCGVCLLQRGRLEAAIDVDHILPHEGDYEVFHDRTNLWGLCKSCHAIKSSLEGEGIRVASRQEWASRIANSITNREDPSSEDPST